MWFDSCSSSCAYVSESDSSASDTSLSVSSDVPRPCNENDIDSSSLSLYSFPDASTNASVETAVSSNGNVHNMEALLKTAKSEGGDFVNSLNTAYEDGESEIIESQTGTDASSALDESFEYDDSESVKTAKQAGRQPIIIVALYGKREDTDAAERFLSSQMKVFKTFQRSALITAIGSLKTAHLDDEFVLPDPVFSEYSLEPSETAVEFPNEDVEALPEPIYSEYSTQPSEVAVELSEESFQISEAKSMGTSESEFDDLLHPQVYSHLMRDPEYIDEEFHSRIKSAFAEKYPPSEYVLSELNESTLDFNVIKTAQEYSEANADFGEV
ncbi:unnamed protein product [Toxocara canis]|uniref:DM5 domain-containing protein n=1 Tax=Toxocara canis TaxID=6265 RepID=A0A183UNR9_TOXCA|nr:unnamed protein product [Toxocara canis]